MRSAIVFLSAMLTISATYAQQSTGSQNVGWVSVIVWAGMASILLYCGYMVISGDISDNARRIMSIIAAIAIASLALTSGINFLGSIFGVDWMYNKAATFLDEEISDTTDLAIQLASAQAATNIISSIKIETQKSKSGKGKRTVNAGAVAKPLSKILDFLLNSVWAFIGSMSFHRVLLELGHKFAMSVIFPVGVLLYMLPSLKKAGAILIAISLAFWILFPATILLIIKPISDKMSTEDIQFYNPQIPPIEVAKKLSSDFERVFQDTEENPPVKIGPFDLFTMYLGTVKEGALYFFFNWWAKMVVVWYIVPFINIIMFFIAIDGMADAIGGDRAGNIGMWARKITKFR